MPSHDHAPGECSHLLSYASVSLGEYPGLVRVPTNMPIWISNPCCSLAAVVVSPIYHLCTGSCYLEPYRYLFREFMLVTAVLLYHTFHFYYPLLTFISGGTLANTLNLITYLEICFSLVTLVYLCHLIHTHFHVSWHQFLWAYTVRDSPIITLQPHIYFLLYRYSGTSVCE